MRKVRIRRGGHLQKAGGRVLGHDRAVNRQRAFEPVPDTGVGGGPGSIIPDPAVNRTDDFPPPVGEEHVFSHRPERRAGFPAFPEGRGSGPAADRQGTGVRF